jgi:two-component sensor histidine kinase
LQFDELRQRLFGNRRHDYTFDYRIIRADSGVRWIESRGFVSYDQDGQPQHVIGINIDVTERKQTEALLKESKTRLSDALAAGQVLAFDWDAATGRSQRSDNADRIMGFVDSGRFLQQLHADDRGNFKAHIRGLSPDDPSYALTFRFDRADGRQVWLEETARGEFDATGKLLRIKGLTRDITERKQAELALAERNAQLALAGKAARVGHFAHDLDTGLVTVSKGYAAIHDLPEGTTQTPIDQWRNKVHADDLAKVDELRRKIFKNRRRDYTFDYRIVRPDGDVKWIDSRSFVFYDGEGQPRRIVGINIDITERKALEDHKTTLISELDHRVKNVLATVCTVASRTQETSSSMAEFIAALEGRIKSMAITHELLSSQHWQGIPLAELVRRELAPYATASNSHIGGSDVMLSAEAGQILAMVFHELATNAAKFGAMSAKSGRVSVRWNMRRSQHADSQLCIEWRERGGPLVALPTRSGFGTSIVRELVPYELGGTVDLMHPPEGVRCRLQIPAHWLSASNGPKAPHALG